MTKSLERGQDIVDVVVVPDFVTCYVLYNYLLAFLQSPDTSIPRQRIPTTSEIDDAALRYSYVRYSMGLYFRGEDSPVKRAARECLDEMNRETPRQVFHYWGRVRAAGEESKAYSPELRRTLVSLWERWSDKKAVEEEFAFLMLNGRWHAGLPDKDLNRLPKEAVLEGMEMWLEKRRRSGGENRSA